MNSSFGSAGVVLGFAASVGGIITLALGLWRRDGHVVRSSRRFVRSSPSCSWSVRC
jgi:hypothetical protein